MSDRKDHIPIPADNVIAIEISDDIDKPNKYQTDDGKWHEGFIPTNDDIRWANNIFGYTWSELE